MIFLQKENGKIELVLTFKERVKFFILGKIILTDIGSRHFGNHLVKAVIEWQKKFDPEIVKLATNENTPIDTE
jgi:hypothetical protein